MDMHHPVKVQDISFEILLTWWKQRGKIKHTNTAMEITLIRAASPSRVWDSKY
jgi:hypothetical protein